MAPRKKSIMPLTNIPGVNELCAKLGFQSGSTRTNFMGTTHAWRYHYKTQSGRSGADLIDWKSSIGQQELTVMAMLYLQSGYGEKFWSNNPENAGLQYPRDISGIAELLKQLFVKQNRYRVQNETYGKSKPENALQKDKSTSVQEEPSSKEKSDAHHEPEGNVPTSLNMTPKQIAAPELQIENGLRIMGSPATADIDINAAAAAISDIPLKSVEQASTESEPALAKENSPSKILILKTNPQTQDRSNHNVGTNDADQHNKTQKGPAKPRKRRRYNYPLVPTRKSGRHTQTTHYGPEVGSETDSGDDSSSSIEEVSSGHYNTFARIRPEPAQQAKQIADSLVAGVQANQVSAPAKIADPRADEVLVPSTRDIAGSQLEDSILQDSEQNTTVERNSQTKEPERLIPLPGSKVVNSQQGVAPSEGSPGLLSVSNRGTSHPMSPDPTPKSKPDIRGRYYVIDNPEPNYTHVRWKDGTFRGKSLSSVIQEVSRLAQRSDIETLKLRLKTPYAVLNDEVSKGDEKDWEGTKQNFTDKIKEAWTRKRNQSFEYTIWIEPICTAQEGDDEDFDYVV